jgi:hypothetical protein
VLVNHYQENSRYFFMLTLEKPPVAESFLQIRLEAPVKKAFSEACGFVPMSDVVRSMLVQPVLEFAKEHGGRLPMDFYELACWGCAKRTGVKSKGRH